ncbi:MAG: prepilin-type N-terminal cleavage/methylation domain-containing protein [Candidatus Omnitrophica bacterium]|jgi:type II secretory pathway component PulJ|nr:prepilin-type N-terminal cleavage/methylation domain-containing protein [Candidatus Omnitrophota bacterium]
MNLLSLEKHKGSLDLSHRNVMRLSFSRKMGVNHNFCAGFTILEVLIAAAIFSIVIGMTFLALNTGMSSWFSGDVEVELRREIIKALTTMEKELKYTAPAQTDLADGATATSLNFHLPNKDANGVVINWGNLVPSISWSADIITYERNVNGEIIRRTSSGEYRVLARNITSLQFSRLAPPDPFPDDMLRIDITVQKADKKGRVLNDTVQLLVKMRNR